MPKLAFISDTHIGPTGYFRGIRRKLTEYAEPYLAEFAQHVAEQGDYAFVVQLGDLIEDMNPESDRSNYATGCALLAQSGVPVHNVLGNHDTARLTADELLALNQRPAHFYSFDVDGAHFVVLHTQHAGGLALPSAQVDWLRADLAAAAKPTVVFAHHSFADQDLIGNPWFEGAPEQCLADNREDVRALLRESGHVVAVVNGHLHWNHVDWHDDIPYITVQSATENCDNLGTPAHAWGVVEVDSRGFRLEQFGNTPFTVAR